MGHCPSSVEFKSTEIKKLAQRLKGKTVKETLTNILEWQDRNINFWFERYYLFLIFIFIFFVIVLLIYFTILSLSSPLNLISPLWCLIISLSLILPLSVTTYIMLKSYRRIPLKQIKYVIFRNMSVNLIIEYKLGICPDYAKLTACLLKNLYPDGKIGFVKSCGHVATGMFVGEKLYMLDQCLPIKTINGWHKYRKSYKKFYPLKGKCNKAEPISVGEPNFDIDKLKLEITHHLNLSEKDENVNLSQLDIILTKGALYYDYDAFVNYSLIQWLKNKIVDERLDLSQISNIEIKEPNNSKDLTFRIYYRV